MFNINTIKPFLSIGLLSSISSFAFAADIPSDKNQSGPVLEEVIVTAQKRTESLQDVPLAITAISGQSMRERGIDGLEGLQFAIPNFNLGQQLGVARISLRGVGLENLSAGAEGSIAFYSDGIFYSRPAAALSGLYDIERVEVLRGPQGTLYGRNATGGAINVITAKPTEEFEGYANLSYGNYNAINFEGAVGGALIKDTLRARLSARTQDRDGYGTNIISGADIDNSHTRSVRFQLEALPSEDLSLLLRANYHKEDDNNYGYHFINQFADENGVETPALGLLLGGQKAVDPRDIASDLEPKNDREIWSAGLEINYDFGWGHFKSLTAYLSTEYLTRSDLDSTSFPLAPITQFENAQQFSQELQLSGEINHFTWLAGLYYFEEDIDGGIDIPINDILFGGTGTMMEGFFGGGSIDTQASAAFGQVNYQINETWALSVGLRYSDEKKSAIDQFRFDVFTPEVPGAPVIPLVELTPSVSFNSITPRYALEYTPADNLLFFASVSKGFKAGGINLGGVQKPYQPEKVWSYEAGVKADLLGNRLRANLTGFYYDYTDLQVGRVKNNILVLENAADATIKGLEIELFALPVEGLQLEMVFSYLDARLDKFITGDQARPALGDIDLSGNTVSQAPKFTVNAAAQYRWFLDAVSVTLRGEIFWVDNIYFTPFNLKSAAQPAHSRQNIFLTVEDSNKKWFVQAYIKNIDGGNDIANSFVSTNLVGNVVNGFYEEPRTYGIKIGHRF